MVFIGISTVECLVKLEFNFIHVYIPRLNVFLIIFLFYKERGKKRQKRNLD